MTTIIGISAWYHDSAAALIQDGAVIAAAQEERFSRIKGDASFPTQALKYCLEAANIQQLSEVDYFVFYEKPFIKFERLLETHLNQAPFGLRQFVKAIPSWIKQKLIARRTLERDIRQLFSDKKTPFPPLLFNDHHGSHAAMAFFTSSFNHAAILCFDGVGEWGSGSAWLGKNNTLIPLWQIDFPHSLGLLYSAFASFCGFKVNSGEYKLMGLAPYGKPIYVDLIEQHLIDIKPDGSFRMNLAYFDYQVGPRMTNRKFAKLFGGPALPLSATPSQREMDLAASIQAVIEKVVLRAARHLQKITGAKHLCLGGGVALNCVATGKLEQAKIFEHVFVNPAPGDAGSAVGAALACWHEYLDRPKDAKHAPMSAYLGPKFDADNIQQRLITLDANFEKLSIEALLAETAALLAEGKVVGWFQGRMEFGPRALGNRSILADPRSANMIKHLNLKIKKRESFRPFAPSVLAEQADLWFETGLASSPFMNKVAAVREASASAHHDLQQINNNRSAIAAVTHIDASARIHTVTEQLNPLFYNLIQHFEQLTEVPLLVNTSFNVRGEPIVCTPDDAWRCFMQTDMDVLVIGCFLLRKEEQTAMVGVTNKFQPD